MYNAIFILFNGFGRNYSNDFIKFQEELLAHGWSWDGSNRIVDKFPPDKGGLILKKYHLHSNNEILTKRIRTSSIEFAVISFIPIIEYSTINENALYLEHLNFKSPNYHNTLFNTNDLIDLKIIDYKDLSEKSEFGINASFYHKEIKKRILKEQKIKKPLPFLC